MLDSEELSATDYKAHRAYKRKLWVRVLLSGIFLPIAGAIIATVFIHFLAYKTKKNAPTSISLAVMATIACIALLMFPSILQNTEKPNDLFIKALEVFSIFFPIVIMIVSIFGLSKNINSLAESRANKFQSMPLTSQECNNLWQAIKRPWREVQNIADTRNDATIIARAESLRLVLRHIKTIITKCEQATYSDSYGEVKFDGALKEIDYFVDKVIRNNLVSARLPQYFSPQQYTKILSGKLYKASFINAFLKDIICQFFNAYSPWDFDKAIQNLAIKYAEYLNAGRYTCSKRSLRFLLGDDYKHIHKEALSLANGANSTVTAATLIHTLISPDELSNLRKWFVERNARVLNLNAIVTGEEFEVFCQRQLQELGWHAQVTRATGDFGADLVAERNGITIIVQCKYYSKPVGVKAVQEAFSAMTFYNAHKAAVVSNQSYTRAAEQMAEKNNVVLLHVNELDRLG